jgi:ketosteroid isomerase-like protein
MPLHLQQTIPILRILDVPKAREFYLDYLGFNIDWEHRFGDNFPLYMQVSREGILLHLSEHYGDSLPGAAVFVRVTGLREFHAELAAKDYRYYKPGIEATGHRSLCVNLLDPFGNKLRLEESLPEQTHAPLSPNVQLVQSLYAAFLRRDIPFVLDRIAPDFEILQSPQLPWGGHYHGPQGLQQFFTNLATHLINAALPIDRYLDAGDHVVALGHTQGTVKATQKPFDVPLAHVWHIQNGKAARFTPYIDNPTMLATMRP